ncbi:pyrroloquinoline quinone biosynthesis protein PqqB [Planctomycetes bacterium Poly30]|uniref:Pyrroloquinoline quinone biosynthesis protein PqqB n=1 Tax=Saltatorellus ferox TaxID=2528018 RepID=A0A518EKQ2_9BACT|nr:pyrroloquinoline quinone biosynthesis protein PqqB [Planctomycetes bacterium Poly30]
MWNRFFFAAGLLGVLSACRSTALSLDSDKDPAAPYLVVLGTAQDGGLPQMACRQPCCEAARRDPARRRLVTSLLLVDPRPAPESGSDSGSSSGRRWIFDASPDLPLQVERARGHGGPALDAPGRPELFDGVFLTHAHVGHYAGLIQFGREVYGSAPVDLIGTPRMTEFLRTNGPWSLLFDGGHANAVTLTVDQPYELADDLRVTALKVPHRDEFSDTVGFLIEGPTRAALYLPDIDKWNRWERPLAEVLENVDLAFLDGTFHGPEDLPGRDMAEVPHPFIVETIEALADEPAPLLNRVYFTHLNHSNPAADPASKAAAAVRASGAHVLEEGARFAL